MKTNSAFALLPVVLAAFAAVATPANARTDLAVGMVLEPPHLDPTAGAAAAIDEVVYANIFEGLTRIENDGSVAKGLAENWVVSPDGLTYTFELRPGVTFHDGTALDAGDVVFSLERILADGSVNAQKALFTSVESVEQRDELTVEITLSQPAGDLLYNLGWGDAVIVAPESAVTNKENPVGTGPFRFVRWRKGVAVDLERNESYWGDEPALETASFRFIPDPAAATASLLAGDVQAFPNLPAPESVAQFQADPRFAVTIGTTEGETILATNNTKAPFDDVRVRRALALAINRFDIIEGAMFGLGTPIGSHFPPHHPAYVELSEIYPFDPDAARALLAEAGYPDGFSTTLKLPPPSYARRGGEIIAAQLRAVGIDAEIIPVEWPVWLDEVFTRKDYDLTIVSHTEPNDIGIYARDDYYFGYDNAAFDAIIEELAVSADQDTRYTLWREAQTILADDAVNGFLFQLSKNGVWDAKLTGLWANAPIQANDLTDVRWQE